MMDAGVLAEAIAARILTEQDSALAGLGLSPSRTPVRVAMATATATAIADEIVNHIKSFAQVSVNTTVAAGIPVAVVPATGIGVTTGPGSGTEEAGTIS